MKNLNAHLPSGPCLLLMVAAAWLPSHDGSAAALPLVTAPLYLTSAVPPLVMLNVTKDQNLYQKAYNDYSDLDGDGKAETTYKHTIDYYGYFDSYKCYTYGAGLFSPVGGSYTGTKPATCNGAWHGNFLNWVSMSRMDALRKLLYGGLRQTDTLASTVLERAYIPTDAHSWPKYYNPAMALAFDTAGTAANYPAIDKLTPYNPPTAPVAIASATSNTLTLGRKLFAVPATTSFAYGDQVLIEDGTNSANYMIGSVGCVNGTGITMYNGIAGSTSSCATGQISVAIENAVTSTAATLTNWKIYNWTQTGITFCNTTNSDGGANNISQTNTLPPLMKVAYGNYSLWSANERWQCYWAEDKANATGSLGGTAVNGNRAALSGVYASSIAPNKTTVSSGRIANGVAGASSDFNVRVAACVAGAIGKEKCGSYPSGNLKPIGLLQVYGESGQLKFGLMTGSYAKNTSGGTLRKNVGTINDEINVATDGSFKAAPAAGSIIASLNLMRIYGYSYTDGTYMTGGGAGDDCSYGLTTITEGKCLNWGNPMSEIYLESIRYLAGLSATAAFDTSDTAKIAGLGKATWVDPLSNANYCAPLNVLNFNASAPSYDRDQMAGASALGGSPNAATLTNAVGTAEGLGSGNWYVGNNGGTNNDLCSAKPISAFGSVYGICPEGPGTEGSYLMAGLAYHVHTNRIRNDLTSVPVPSIDKTSLKVSTYGIALATNVPKISVPGTSMTILPLGRLLNGSYGGGTLVDFKIVCQIPTTATALEVAAVTKDSAGMCAAAGSGAFYINWEDSEQGGDYDQDMWGRLKYQVNAGATPTVTITTDVVSQSTGYKFGFGYSISGTTMDGPHIHSGINGFVFADPTAPVVTGDTSNISGGACNGCTSGNLATSVTYTQSGSVSGVLNDPLWYAAKYGGFKDTNSNSLPDLASEWDIRTSSGATGADGIPDNYFFVTNPNALEAALDQAFIAILTDSSSSSVAASTTKLNTNTYIYQASFNATDWSGSLQAFKIDPNNGSIATTAAWNSGTAINSQDYSSGRTIISYNPTTKAGIPFRWLSLTTGVGSQQAYLNRDPNSGNAVDANGSARLDYLRGSTANEGLGSTNFRRRTLSKLGDIVDSSPTYVGAPDFPYIDTGYATFKSTYATRTPIIYVGSNDGMLHGFEAATGKEKLGYVPNKMFANLNQLSARNYSHRYYVNATPSIGDVYFSASSTWKTVLVGGLGNGGRGIYALDVTNPANFSEANASSLVLWEFTDADDADLGFTQSQVAIVKVCISGSANGCTASKWVAIFGNGYNNTQASGSEVASSTGQAALYVLYLDKPAATPWTLGTNYFKILTGVGSVGTPNGLASPSPIDVDVDVYSNVDIVYAGDLQGNMHRFDLTGAPNTWNSQVLITVRDGLGAVQPITSAPEVGNHRTGSGLMVFFGTGQYLATGDNGTTGQQTQTFYAIWDKFKKNSTGWVVPATSVVGLRSDANFHLLKQVIYTETVGADGNAARVTSDTADVPNKSQYYMNWIGAVGPPVIAANTGWYIDLYNTNYLTTPASTNFGERQVTNSVLSNGVIEFATLIPNASACTAGGSGWIMKLDPNDGGRAKSGFLTSAGETNAVSVSYKNGAVVATGTVGATVATGILVSGSKSATGIPTTVTIIADKKARYEYTSLSSGTILMTKTDTSRSTSTKVSWREIVD